MTQRLIFLFTAFVCTMGICSQELPQFTSNDFEGWVYNNPNVPITSSNIVGGRIKLYVDKTDLVLALTSPEFSCQGIDSINASVTWYLKAFYDSNFDLSKTALTMVLDDSTGTPLDSVTVTSTTDAGPTPVLTLSLPVPEGADKVRLRFVSWDGDVLSSGAIKRALITAVTASPHHDDSPDGDADGNGVLNITDVTLAIQYILNGSADIHLQAIDMDSSGEVNISDVVMMIQKLMTS